MKIVIRHGILSNHANMSSLENALASVFPGTPIDNQTYTWTDSILMNGVRLASNLIAAAQMHASHRRVAMVGHSMGGLVCRVANAAITDPNFRSHAATYVAKWPEAERKWFENVNLLPGYVDVCGVVTLATPNSGAMRKGQLQVIGFLINTAKPFSFASAGIKDLQTEHLFRVLQHCKTTTPCLTISGSFVNRFGGGMLRNAYRTLARYIATVAEPHDLVVEDESVDLSKSILPHEFRGPVEHQRAYLDCIDVTHTNIHATAEVHKRVATFIRGRCV